MSKPGMMAELFLAAVRRRGVRHALRAAWHILRLAIGRRRFARRRTTALFGLRFAFDSPDSLEALLHEQFALNVFHFRAVVPDPVILDVGANVGDTVLYFKHLYPRAKVFAFEPLPDAFRLLVRNVESNGLQNVRAFQEALSDRNGTLVLHYQPVSSYALTGSDPEILTHLAGPEASRAGFTRVEVPCRRFRERLAALDLPSIDLLKMDVEGAEVLLLQDIEDWLPRVKSVAIEFHMASEMARNSFDLLGDILHRNGYHLRVFGDTRTWDDGWPGSETFYVRAARPPTGSAPV